MTSPTYTAKAEPIRWTERTFAPGTYRFMRVVSPLGSAGATICVGVVLTAAGASTRHTGLVALASNALSHLAVQVLKRMVARPRPADNYGRPLALVELPDPFSFPSGHAAAATAVATANSWGFPWLSPALMGLAVSVAASRVILRLHHVGDVVAGVLLGLAGVAGAELLIT